MKKSEVLWIRNKLQIGISIVCCIALLFITCLLPVHAEEQLPVSVEAPSVILIEASTGQVICEKNADAKLRPASITKIMTLLLAFEALDAGKISLGDEVATSAYAKSMGGSQVFLEEGEIQTVETLIKCIAVASGNDAAVAIAEHISGSEQEFVAKMNERAAELGMTNTHFEDCCGLTDSENHITSARDVAIMSRELIMNHPEIYNYTMIWMEDIVHNTVNGSSNFTLSSTNKLLKQYPYATGLKTGSTSLAKYCLSATARKDNLDMIAVVMAAPDFKVRFSDATTLLNYGFSVTKLYTDDNIDELAPQKIDKGVEDYVTVAYGGEFRYLDTTGSDLSGVEKTVELKEEITAPVKTGEQAGSAVYTLNGEKIGTVPIIYTMNVAQAVYRDYVKKVLIELLL